MDQFIDYYGEVKTLPLNFLKMLNKYLRITIIILLIIFYYLVKSKEIQPPYLFFAWAMLILGIVILVLIMYLFLNNLSY